MSDSSHETLIAKWTRKKEKIEAAGKRAKEDVKGALSKVMKDESTHKNILNEVLRARRSGIQPHNKQGYADDGEIISGYERPWERD